jgi:hypothetical protein
LKQFQAGIDGKFYAVGGLAMTDSGAMFIDRHHSF